MCRILASCLFAGWGCVGFDVVGLYEVGGVGFHFSLELQEGRGFYVEADDVAFRVEDFRIFVPDRFHGEVPLVQGRAPCGGAVLASHVAACVAACVAA